MSSAKPCLVQAYQLTVRRRVGRSMSVVMVNKARAIRTLAIWSCHDNVVSVSWAPCTIDGATGHLIRA